MMSNLSILIEMMPHPLLAFGSVALDPAPHGCVISARTTLGQQLFNVTK
jgi:hypothetical protein